VQWCSEQSWATDAKLLKQGIITSNILNVVARYNIFISQLTMDLFHLMYVFFLSSFPRNMFTGLDCINIYKYTTAGDYPIRSSNWLPFESTYVHPRIWWGSCWWTFMVFCIVLCLVFSFCLFLSFMPNVARISRLSNFHCSFGFL
jgi:hypothetical protein